jgi:hypothetical protein
MRYEAGIYEYIDQTLALDDPLKDNFIELQCVMRGLTYEALAQKVVGEFGVTRESLLRNLMILQCGDPYARPALDDQSPYTDEDIPDCVGVDRAVFKRLRYAIIVTRKPKGPVTSLAEFISNPHIPGTQKGATLATAVLAINKMHSMLISHNDQHWWNILVETTTGAQRTYQLDGHEHVIDTPTQPRLFDWDRAQLASGPMNEEFRRFDEMYKPPYSPDRDWLTFFQHLSRLHAHVATLPPLDDLFTIFFREDTPGRVRRRWQASVQSKDKWEFASKTSMIEFGPYISVDKQALLRYLNPVTLTSRLAGMTTESIRQTYNIHLLGVDLVHVKKLAEVLGTWSSMLALDATQLRTFLRKHSAAFGRLRTLKGRRGQITRLSDVLQELSRVVG